jgi:hypothetical protein
MIGLCRALFAAFAVNDFDRKGRKVNAKTAKQEHGRHHYPAEFPDLWKGIATRLVPLNRIPEM